MRRPRPAPARSRPRARPAAAPLPRCRPPAAPARRQSRPARDAAHGVGCAPAGAARAAQHAAPGAAAGRERSGVAESQARAGVRRQPGLRPLRPARRCGHAGAAPGRTWARGPACRPARPSQPAARRPPAHPRRRRSLAPRRGWGPGRCRARGGAPAGPHRRRAVGERCGRGHAAAQPAARRRRPGRRHDPCRRRAARRGDGLVRACGAPAGAAPVGAAPRRSWAASVGPGHPWSSHPLRVDRVPPQVGGRRFGARSAPRDSCPPHHHPGTAASHATRIHGARRRDILPVERSRSVKVAGHDGMSGGG